MLKLLNKIFIVLFIVGFAACKSTEIKQTSHKGTSEAVDVKDNSDVFIDANKAKMLGNVEESRKLLKKR
ncbi:MAG: hypothetical protein R2759_04985 [Bacteroidales bacterium]